LRFFDYLYYGFRKFYGKYESGPGFSALAVVTLTQILNILTVYILYCLITQTKANTGKLQLTSLALYISVLILNIVRYRKLDPDIIKEKWENKKEKQKIILRTLLFLYVVLSFVVCVGLAIYVGNRNNE
jgi:hypothetical protein